MVKLGTLAIDGSRIKANASKHQAMSYERMKKEEKGLRQEIGKIVAAAEEQDRLEDEEFGPDFVGREGKAEPKVRPHLVETRAMQKKLRTARGRATYEKRKHLVEPVFGWIKQVLGFRQFSLRGLAKVRAEWEPACAAVNLRRMGARLEWR